MKRRPRLRPGSLRPGFLRLVLVVALAAMVVVVAVSAPVALRVAEDVRRGPVDLSAVVVYDDLPTTHVPDDVRYSVTPPPGGPHADRWLQCGVYDRPVRDANVVHALEHGTVWLTHAPDLDAQEVAELAAFLPDEGILSPYPGLDAPVVVTVWGRQLALTGADDPRLPLFLEAFGDGGTAPEPMASCEGGVVEYAVGAGTPV